MTRLGALLNAILAAALVGVLAWASAARGAEPWRALQGRYQEVVRRDGSDAAKRAVASEPIRPHEVDVPALGAVDRCTTCHLGAEPGAEAFDGEPPFEAHPGDLLETHPVGRFGCTSCHGGQGRALAPDEAHDRRHGGGPDAFTPAGVRCARCHPAAGLSGTERVSRGVALYFEHGCSGCHQPGRPGPGIGPDLAAIGLRGGAYLRKAVLYPDSVYPQTVMPPLRYKIPERGAEIDALVAYLRTLEPWPAGVARRERRFDPRSCTGCHRVSEPELQPTGPAHRCVYLHDEASWLACARCHAAPPEPPALPSEVPADVAGAAGGEAAEAGPPGGGASAPETGTFAARFHQELVRAEHQVQVRDPAGACPEIGAAMTACGVCHREGEVVR